MPKQHAIAIAAVGAALIIGSLVSLRYPEFSQWFPVLLLFGGGLVVLLVAECCAATGRLLPIKPMRDSR
jgi:peptidoglycan/LPS O-acetylase OafA/YrhL